MYKINREITLSRLSNHKTRYRGETMQSNNQTPRRDDAIAGVLCIYGICTSDCIVFTKKGGLFL